MKTTKKSVVLSQAFRMSRAEARQTFENLKRVGMIPDDLEVDFITVPGAPVVGRFAPSGSTAGARWLRREAA